MNQGMQVNFQTMTQAEKTMLRYQYVMSNARLAMGDFAATANTWANVVKTLKQQFQALGGTIGTVFINAFKPALIALRNFMQHVLDFAKTVADALGAIFGWTIEVSASGSTIDEDLGDAADSMGDLGSGAGNASDGLGDAAGNAKKLAENLSVLPFDELNQLSKDSGGSGSGGSGGSGSGGSGGSGGGGGMSGNGASAALVRTDSVLEKITSDIKTLEELGQYIGDTLIKAMKSIDWAEIYASARNFGTGLAQFLNGLISPELFGETAKLIARSINTAMYAINSFAVEFDWRNLGESIASGINNFFSEWDAKTAGINIMLLVNGVYETIDEILDNLDTVTIGTKIGTFIGEIDIEQILKGFTKLFNKVIDKVGEIFGASFDVAPVQTAILEGLAGIFVVSNFLPLATKFAGVLTSVLGVKGTVILGAIALVTSGIADNLLQELINAVDSVDWLDLGQKVGQWIVDALINVEWLKVIGHAAELVAKIGLAILELIGGALAGIATELGKKVADWFSENYDFSITKAFFGNMAGELDGVMTEVDVFFSQLRQKFDEWMLDMKQNNKFFDSITDFFGLTDENLKLDITAQITKQEDLRERHQRYLDELGQVNEAVDNTGGNTLIDAAAAIDRADNKMGYKPSIETTAKYNEAYNALNENQRTVATWARYDAFKKGALFNSAHDAWRYIPVWAKYDAFKKGALFNSSHNAWRYISVWAQYNASKNNLSKGQRTVGTWADYVKTIMSLSKSQRTISVWVNYKDTTSKHKEQYGGFNGGIFKIGKGFQSFASGGYPYGGQIFRARENGNPELVGTLKGSTAVLNNNQIVSSVSDGVARAIAGIRFQMTGFRPPEIDVNGLQSVIEYAVVSALANNATERPIQNYVTVKMPNGEVLARAVDDGHRTLNYRSQAVAT